MLECNNLLAKSRKGTLRTEMVQYDTNGIDRKDKNTTVKGKLFHLCREARNKIN